MPITQFFSNGTIQKSSGVGPLAVLTCSTIQPDSIDWTDAEVIANSFKQFAIDKGLGESLSFVLSKDSIDRLFNQLPGQLDGVKIYLGYSNKDKTIRAFTVAAKLNTTTTEYDDFQIPVTMAGTTLANLPLIENIRPCPPQCGITNVLNRSLP